MTKKELLVLEGPLTGQRFAVTESGLRLGRSSSCEITISDPALSRNHCLFELRDGAIWITDLASANGTAVNGTELGADSRALEVGDRIVVGDTTVGVVAEGKSYVAPTASAASSPRIDLGFGEANPSQEPAPHTMRRLLLWSVAFCTVAVAAVLVLRDFRRGESGDESSPRSLSVAAPVLYTVSYEKVEASTNGIYRYALTVDRKGKMTVTIDDVPKENRHVSKWKNLSGDALSRLGKIFEAEAFYKLDPAYTGTPLQANTLDSLTLRVVRSDVAVAVTVENTQEPDAFRKVREELETFSKNEMGLWAIQYSTEKLLELSAESRRIGDSKWQERDAQYGNLAAALAAYNEAIVHLETVDPKPGDYSTLVKRREDVAAALQKAYSSRQFQVDRAMNLQDWSTAQRELRILCELVPDPADPRHAEADRKLRDVESRMKKGGR